MEQPLPAEQAGTQVSWVGRGTTSPRTWQSLYDFSKSQGCKCPGISHPSGCRVPAPGTGMGAPGWQNSSWTRRGILGFLEKGMPDHPPDALTGCWGLGQEGCSSPGSCPGAAGAALSPSSHRPWEPSPAQGTLLWCRRLSGVPSGHAASTKHPNTFPRWCGHGTWQAEQLRAVHEARSAYLCAPGLGAGSAPQPSQKLPDQPHWQL